MESLSQRLACIKETKPGALEEDLAGCCRWGPVQGAPPQPGGKSYQNWDWNKLVLVKSVTCRSSSLFSSSSPSSSTVTTSASPTILPTTSQTPSGLDVEASVWSTKKKTIAVAVVVRISIEGGTSPAGSKFPAVHTSNMTGVQNSCNFECFHRIWAIINGNL